MVYTLARDGEIQNLTNDVASRARARGRRALKLVVLYRALDSLDAAVPVCPRCVLFPPLDF